MELEVLQENLANGLLLVSRVLASKPQIPILSHILLKTEKGSLTLVASDQETTIVTKIGAKIEKEGEFTVPGRVFTEIATSLSFEKVKLAVNEGSMTVKSGSFLARVNGLAAQEYPKLTVDEVEADFWEMDKANFCAAVLRVVFASASDEGRAALTGVLFRRQREDLILAATDGFRLSRVEVGGIRDKGEEASFIIPARTLSEVGRILGESKGEKEKESVRLAVLTEKNQVIFDCGQATKIYSRLIAANFPDFEKIIPANCRFKLAISAEEFSRAIRLAAVFARESANIIKLKTPASPAGGQNAKLKISANAPQVGENESEVEVSREGETEETAVAFNYRYLNDYLGSIGAAGEIVIELSGPTSPAVFRTSADKSYLHIIMPVRVQE